MHFTTLLAASFGTLASAARPGQVLHGHTVQDIHARELSAPALADNAVAVMAFFGNKDCTGTPAYLQIEALKCYGPIVRHAGFQLISSKEEYNVLARFHPCGIDDSKYSVLNRDAPFGTCWQADTAERELDIWAQLKGAVRPSSPPPQPEPAAAPPTPEQRPPPPPPEGIPPPPSENIPPQAPPRGHHFSSF